MSSPLAWNCAREVMTRAALLSWPARRVDDGRRACRRRSAPSWPAWCYESTTAMSSRPTSSRSAASLGLFFITVGMTIDRTRGPSLAAIGVVVVIDAVQAFVVVLLGPVRASDVLRAVVRPARAVVVLLLRRARDRRDARLASLILRSTLPSATFAEALADVGAGAASGVPAREREADDRRVRKVPRRRPASAASARSSAACCMRTACDVTVIEMTRTMIRGAAPLRLQGVLWRRHPHRPAACGRRR